MKTPTSAKSTYQVPEPKKTSLQLYVNAREAYEMWKKTPEKIHILDVRTPAEYAFIGHAQAAQNIPLIFIHDGWNIEKNAPVTEPNVEFMAAVKKHYDFNDTILVTCRSGGRSAIAVNMLAQAGFKNVYNIVDGMEGDMIKDADSSFHGKRMKNGWKNSVSDWTYDINPERLWISGNE